MTKLQIIFILISLSFIYITIRAYKKQKIWLGTFCFFFAGFTALFILSFKITWLNAIGLTFWLNRWAELIVYFSIIILFYISFHIINLISKNTYDLTRYISTITINTSYSENKENIKKRKNTTELDDFIFNIRVYNEGIVLKENIKKLINYGIKKYIFINDWSKDDSLEILEEIKKEHPECLMIILSHPINRWGWAANRTWYTFIKTYYKQLQIKRIVGFDPDGQMDIKDLATFQKTIKSHPEKKIFLWSRFIKGGSTYNMPFSRKIILLISKIITRLFYGIKVSDPHNWYRIYSLDALKQIEITADWMHYANQINEQIGKYKIPFIEVPVHIHYTEYSLTKGQKNKNSFNLWWKMIYDKLFSN